MHMRAVAVIDPVKFPSRTIHPDPDGIRDPMDEFGAWGHPFCGGWERRSGLSLHSPPRWYSTTNMQGLWASMDDAVRDEAVATHAARRPQQYSSTLLLNLLHSGGYNKP